MKAKGYRLGGQEVEEGEEGEEGEKGKKGREKEIIDNNKIEK